jgi:ABC-2 type transport system permease protein
VTTPPPGRAPRLGVYKAEWTKLYSVRSTAWSLIALVVVTIGIGAIAAATQASQFPNISPIARLTFDPTAISLAGLLFGQLAIGVLGVLVMSGEYHTGTIRATFAATPRRLEVVLAKVVVFGAVALVFGEVVSLVAFEVGQVILSGSAPHASLGEPAALRAVLGGGLYLAALALLALGLSSCLRHTAGAITAYVAVLLVLPIIVNVLPTSIGLAVGKFLPANIGVTMISTLPRVNELPPFVGLALLFGYAVVALVLGTAVVVRSDA